jgi:hypothetical protein
LLACLSNPAMQFVEVLINVVIQRLFSLRRRATLLVTRAPPYSDQVAFPYELGYVSTAQFKNTFSFFDMSLAGR